uniref:redoxin domain-containing protein n=1 Tax=Phenylobacterium sp. TaxID=1871053 RepID=UPI00286A9A40
MIRLHLAGLAGVVALAAACSLQDPTAATAKAVSRPAASPALRSLIGAKAWLNTSPPGPEDLRGKVVLVNFWTYSCINSLRPLPYLQAWAEKYKDRGLVVIGVHTPEFAFERDHANITRANTALGVTYPVVVDSDYRVWRAFGNQAWPGFYFLDGDGRVRRRILGEGDYANSERVLQQLLSEATGKPVTDPIQPVAGAGPQMAADFDHLRSPETYLGHAQATGFVSPGGFKRDAPSTYTTGTALDL